MLNYKCNKCNNVSDSGYWNMYTNVYYGVTHTNIDKEFEDGEHETLSYVCPKCEKEVDGMNEIDIEQ